MTKRLLVLLVVMAFVVTGLLVPVAAAKGMRKPVLKLQSVEVTAIQGFYLNTKKRRGAIMNLACVFSIYNPNRYPILLDALNFSLYFESYAVNTVKYRGQIWIPGRKTNVIRVPASQSAFTMLLNLLVTAGYKLKPMADKWNKAHPNAKKKKSAAAMAVGLISKWFTKIADYAFPIYLRQGAAFFSARGGRKAVVTINFKYHPK